MGLQQYIKPVEYSFYVWIQSINEDYEPVGVDFFLIFVKNVCYFNAKSWMKLGNLREKILEEIPGFDNDILEQKLYIFETCINFHRTNPYGRGMHFANEKIKKGCYLEKSCKEGIFIEKLKPLPKIRQKRQYKKVI